MPSNAVDYILFGSGVMTRVRSYDVPDRTELSSYNIVLSRQSSAILKGVPRSNIAKAQ